MRGYYGIEKYVKILELEKNINLLLFAHILLIYVPYYVDNDIREIAPRRFSHDRIRNVTGSVLDQLVSPGSFQFSRGSGGLVPFSCRGRRRKGQSEKERRRRERERLAIGKRTTK